MSHAPSPIYVCVVCVVNKLKKKKKRYSLFSGRPTLVWCDIEQGFINCSATLTTVCSFGVGV